jgi:DNA-binding response OmpR family regulator
MRSGARILVADDDPDLLDAITDALQEHGANVIRARTGADLIDRLADSGPFDLVVTDIAMPWLNGMQALRAARTAGIGTAVIVMTGLADKSIPIQVNALGGHAALLRKPFEMPVLESLASELVARTAGTPPSESIHE